MGRIYKSNDKRQGNKLKGRKKGTGCKQRRLKIVTAAISSIKSRAES